MLKTSNISFARKHPAQKAKASHNQHKEKHAPNKVKVAALVGSSAGIGLTVLGMMHKLKKGKPADIKIKYSDLKFDEKDVMKLGFGSILGGLTAGALTDKKSNLKAKLKEANTQFFGNVFMPVALLALNNKIFKPQNIKMPQINEARKFASKLNPAIKKLPQVGITIASLIGGLTIGNKITNSVNKKVFKDDSKREIKTTDFAAHTDDLCFAGTFLFKSSKLRGLMSKILPATLLVSGMETGAKQTKINQ